MPSWGEFQPYIATGLALGGLYALSGVGLVVLYRATGVLNLAFGAVGAMGAFIAYSIIQAGSPGWLGWIVCILFGGVVTLGYGMVFGPLLAGRGPLVQSVSTLGLALVLFGAIDLAWPTSGGQSPSISFPTDNSGYIIGQLTINWTEIIALLAWHRHHRRYRRLPALLQAGYRDAGDGQRPGDHRHPRRPGPPG